MQALSPPQLATYAFMLFSGMLAMGIGLLLIWQGTFERVNQLLFTWAMLIGVQEIVLVLNALSATYPLYTPVTSTFMARAGVTLDILSHTVLFLSIVLYAQLGNSQQRRWLLTVLFAWFSYVMYETHFNYWNDPLFANAQFNPMSGYPIPAFDQFPPKIFKMLVTIAGVIGMLFALPIIAWHQKLERSVFYATLVLAAACVVGILSITQLSNVNLTFRVLGYSLLAYTILYGNVFDPVRQANQELEQSQRDLKEAYADVEQQVFDRTLELESAVAREHILAQELENALADAVRLNQMKSQIIETVSHEFRTPLTKISTSTELLTKYADRLKPDKRAQLQQKIEDAIHYMTRLIENVLLIDTGSQSQTTVEPRTVTMESLCRTLERQARHLFADERHITIAYQTPDTRHVTVDSDLLGQVLQQLIDNARKFSPAQDAIYVQLSMFDQSLQLSVTDAGIGIPANDLPHVYDLFYRGSNIETRRGLGVGLYAVKRIVCEMGGLISAESTPTNTTFTVTIPALPRATKKHAMNGMLSS